MTTIAKRIATIGQWTPRRLGASLLAWWDAEVAASLTLSGGNVATWADLVGGYSPTQAVGGSRPAYSASGFNGRPVVSFDGVDDELTLTGVPAGIPTGGTASEIWALVDQKSLAADATARYLVSIGTGSTTQARNVHRDVVGGVNRARARVGDGTTTVTASNLSVDLSGRHVVRAIFGGTSTQPDVDGVAGTPVAVVPATANTRMRFGATVVTTASAFALAGLNTVIITPPLDAGQAAQLYAYLNRRL